MKFSLLYSLVTFSYITVCIFCLFSHIIIYSQDICTGMGDIAADPVAKALAVVTVGKLCVLNQMWVKQLTRPLVKLLKISQDLPTLMNIIYVLRDMCVR